jgi:hypothetical protein
VLGLRNAWSQEHTFDTIAGPIAELREKYPSAGANAMCTYLWNSYDMCVSRYVTCLDLSILRAHMTDKSTGS